MAKVASKPKKRPGLTRRMARSTVWARRTRHRRDGGPQDRRQGQDQRRPGDRGRRVGRLPGTQRGRRRRPLGRPPDRPAGGRYRRLRGQRADPQEIPAKSWKDIAKRTLKEVKADQVPPAAGGRERSMFCWPCSRGHHRRRLHPRAGLETPQTVRDQINQLTNMLSPETAKLVGTQPSRSPAAPEAPSGWPPSSAS